MKGKLTAGTEGWLRVSTNRDFDPKFQGLKILMKSHGWKKMVNWAQTLNALMYHFWYNNNFVVAHEKLTLHIINSSISRNGLIH